MFSEDEIMGYLGVDTWDDVLASFGEGGEFAGQWGLLGVLRSADLGDDFAAVRLVCGTELCAEYLYAGVFGEDQDGSLTMSGRGRYWGNSSFTNMLRAGAANRDNQVGVYFYVNEWRTAAQTASLVLKFDSSRVDWTSVSLGVGGLGQDAGIPLAIAGAASGNPFLLTAGIAMTGLGTASEATGAARSFSQYENGNATALDLTVSFGSSVLGLVPGPIGIRSSIGGIAYELVPGLYWSP